MRRLLATAVTAAVLAAAPAIASAEVTTWAAVDSVGTSYVQTSFYKYWVFAVTGIREGADAPSTEVLLSFVPNTFGGSEYGRGETLAHCHQMALLSMAKPGRFQLEVTSEPANPLLRLAGCTLTRID
jgi:hypothetical protein